jgi:hypothetical protein
MVAGLVVLTGIGVSKLGGQSLSDLTRRAEPYNPTCSGNDAPCKAWQQFRLSHPYPYQAIQMVPLPNGSAAVILSEPPPIYSRQSLDVLVRSAFGPDLKSLARHRWRMGVDGWLEDLVLQVETGASATGDPLDVPLMRDRMAFLHLALFGTAFGANTDVDRTAGKAALAPPDLDVSPSDLRRWLADPNLRWRRVDGAAGDRLSWQEISAAKATGTFASLDSTVVVLAARV